VSDEELLSVLVMEPDLQKAAQALIQKALDRDGPDNITVVLARFDGEGLKPALPEDVVGFVGYDPGGDPIPEAVGLGGDVSLGAETVEERLPRDMLTPDDVPTKADPDEPQTTKPVAVGRTARSLLAVFLLALVAAAAGGIFVMKCQSDQTAHGDGRANLP
jgi:hypothetical protein